MEKNISNSKYENKWHIYKEKSTFIKFLIFDKIPPVDKCVIMS